MSERIRSLESAYRASGEACDLLAWLRAQQRAGLGELAPWVEALTAGQLHPEQLELAAYLGDPLARLLDEERAISLATYLGEGLELVPLVLGDEASPESIARWIAALNYWCPSWVAEAQYAIAADHLERYRAPEPAADDPYAEYYGSDYSEDWRRTLAAVRETLDRGTPLPDPHVSGYGEVAELVRAAVDLAHERGSDTTWDRSRGPSWVSIELGPEPALVPQCVREALLPKILRTL
tara:strand:+ start:1819 stop:2529 length:711 start_codon:yes stop_codon:yes gene_type:complete